MKTTITKLGNGRGFVAEVADENKWILDPACSRIFNFPPTPLYVDTEAEFDAEGNETKPVTRRAMTEVEYVDLMLAEATRMYSEEFDQPPDTIVREESD